MSKEDDLNEDDQGSNSVESKSKEDVSIKEDDSKEAIKANTVEVVDGEELVYYYDYAQVVFNILEK